MEVEGSGFSVWCAPAKVTVLFSWYRMASRPSTPDLFSPSQLLLTHLICFEVRIVLRGLRPRAPDLFLADDEDHNGS